MKHQRSPKMLLCLMMLFSLLGCRQETPPTSYPYLLVSITLDPGHDTPEVLRQYAAKYQADHQQWRFLTGEKQQIYQLLRTSFLANPKENPKEPNPGLRITHSARFMLVDQEGVVRGSYDVVVPNLNEDGKLDGTFHIDFKELEQLHRDALKLSKGDSISRKWTNDHVIDFTLLDQHGKEVTMQSLKGRVWITARFFTRCSMSCPYVTRAMSYLQQLSQGKSIEQLSNDDNPKPATPWQVQFFPTFHATLNSICTVFLLAGYILIKKRSVKPHAICMISALIVSTIFLCSYVYYHYVIHYQLGVGHTPFQGPSWAQPLYYSILISHTVLALVVVPLVLITLYRAVRKQFDKHRKIAIWCFPIWLYVSITGVLVYLFLYQFFPSA